MTPRNFAGAVVSSCISSDVLFVTATGFTPGSTVSFTFDDPHNFTFSFGTADGTGSIERTVYVPRVAPGNHTVIAYQGSADDGINATRPLVVFGGAALGGTPIFAIVNDNPNITDASVAAFKNAMQTYLTSYFYPRWPSIQPQQVAHYINRAQVPTDAWVMHFYPYDGRVFAPGVAAYHSGLTSLTGPPFISKAYAFTATNPAGPLGDYDCVSMCHEFLEAAANPGVTYSGDFAAAVFDPHVDPNGRRWLHEVCDAVYNETPPVISGVKMSPFLLPSWYQGGAGPWDYPGERSGPFEFSCGGFLQYANADLSAFGTYEQTC